MASGAGSSISAERLEERSLKTDGRIVHVIGFQNPLPVGQRKQIWKGLGIDCYGESEREYSNGIELHADLREPCLATDCLVLTE